VATSGSLEVLVKRLLARVRELESVVHRGGCSWRSRSGREPGKAIGVDVADVVDEPDERFEVCPDRYARCKESLDNAFDTVTVDTVWAGRQIVDVDLHHHRKSLRTTQCHGVAAGPGSGQRLPR
jgi:hypothetical protein